MTTNGVDQGGHIGFKIFVISVQVVEMLDK